MSPLVCVCRIVLALVSGLVLVAPVLHVEGILAGFLLPRPRVLNLDVGFTQGVCDYAVLGAPTSTLYYGKNQLVVRMGNGFTENSFRQIKLYGYVNSNSVNRSTTTFAGSYNGIGWTYDEPSSRVLSRVYNGTAPPPNFPPSQTVWNQVCEIDIPQGISCTPHCTLQLVAKTVTASGVEQSVVSCADVIVMERRPTPIYMTLRPDGCCPLEPVTIARRLYEMFGSNTSMNPFAATSYPLWDYTSDMSWIVSNIWYIDETAPNTLKINPQTGYYSVKLVIHDQYNQTAQQFITTLTNTQLVSSALSPDSRGDNNSYVWWGDAPNTYPNGAGRSMNAASPSASASFFISIIATAISAVIMASFKHI